MFTEGVDVGIDGVFYGLADVVDGVSGGGAAGEVGDVGGEGVVGGAFDEVNVFHAATF